MLFKKPLTNSTGRPEEVFLLRNAEALQKIAIFADLSEGFTVGFVEVASDIECALAIQSLEAHNNNLELQWISLKFDDPDLRYLITAISDALQKIELIPEKKVVLMLRGLEKAIGAYGDYPIILSNLNIARDTYTHKLPYPMLFFLPSYAMTRFARFAPDFWAWKSIEVRLQSDIKRDYLPELTKIIPSDVTQGALNFVGREAELNSLHDLLQKEEIVSVCAIRGMGGVGKTELATHYAHKFRAYYSACYWFSLAQGSLPDLVLAKALPYLEMPKEILNSDDIYEQVRWCWQNWHPTEGKILLILDDVRNLDDIPKQSMPISPRFKIILTTRRRNLSPYFRELQLGLLQENESIELLKIIVGEYRINKEINSAKEICRYVGYLPLAIELIGTYLKQDEILRIEEYLQQLNLHDLSISDEMTSWISTERSILSTFKSSWISLRDTTKQIAMLLSRFAPAEIPWEDGVEPTIKLLGWDDEAIKKGRIQLNNLHLISIQEDKNIRIHPLLREYFRYQGDQMGEEFVRSIQKSIAISMLTIAKSIPQAPAKDFLEKISVYIPHLHEVSEYMLDDIPNPDENLSWVFIGIARFYQGKGLYSLAEDPYKKCLISVQNILGKNHPAFATSLNNLASLYYSQGRYSEAEPLYLQALALRQELLGERHSDVVFSLNDLAGLYSSQGKYDEAEPLYKQALALSQELLGEYHPDVASSLNNLAGLYFSQGKYAEAEPLYKQASSLSQELLGENHPDVASRLNNLAFLYYSQGRYSEAESLYLKALVLRQELLGERHPDVASSLNNLALLYYSQGRYSEAESLYLKALVLRQELLGERHPDVASSLNNLALLYYSQGRYSEAESLYKQALALSQELLGERHPAIGSSLNNLAGLYSSQGRYDEAEPLYKQALALSQELLGEHHPTVATSLNNLALLYFSQGRYDKAEPIYRKSLVLRQELLGERHPDVATSLNNLALLYFSQGKYDEAEPLYLQTLQIAEQVFGINHPKTLKFRNDYELCLQNKNTNL